METMSQCHVNFVPLAQVCDMIPAPHFLSDLPASTRHMSDPGSINDPTVVQSPPDRRQTTVRSASRTLCVRHQRMADEGTSSRLQQSLDALSLPEREVISSIWASFSSSPHPRRALILQGLLTMCCFSQLSLLSEQLAHLIRIDPFAILPHEVCLRVLSNLDATSLCRAAQVSRRWRVLADDNILWRGICEQHIGQKCLKCGWALPILGKKRIARVELPSPPYCQGFISSASKRRVLETRSSHPEHPVKRRQLESNNIRSYSPFSSNSFFEGPRTSEFISYTSPFSTTRPWKDVYCERLAIERNWRRGKCTVRTLTEHTDGVMCLQFSERLSHPSYPILITGSYDRTARVWNLETGVQLRCLKGHTRAIRALQFDDVKLITGSMDNTIRVWDWRKGKCIRTLTGHTEGVVCLQFDSNVLASGSVDTTIKVWNLRSQEAFTLRGHTDWVNSVQLWDSPPESISFGCSSASTFAPRIDPGKMLFSASDDGTIRLWDLTQRSCIRQFVGHVAQVQSLRLLPLDKCSENWTALNDSHSTPIASSPVTSLPQPRLPIGLDTSYPSHYPSSRSCRVPGSEYKDEDCSLRSAFTTSSMGPVLISGSLDNTIKTWDIYTGKTLATLFGHIEGVWAIASDKLRLVSGSHDRTIKVWNREENRCTATLVGHRGAVTCLGLGEDKIVSGSDDGDVKIWSFSG